MLSNKGLIVALTICAIGGCRDSTGPAPPGPTPVVDAGGDHAWIQSSFHADNVLFVECLSEPLRAYGDVQFQYHEVSSGSGTYAFMFRVRPTTPNIPAFYGLGLNSGNTFEFMNAGPSEEIVYLSPGEVNTAIATHTALMAGDRNRLVGTVKFDLALNAQRELTVSKVGFFGFRCVALGRNRGSRWS